MNYITNLQRLLPAPYPWGRLASTTDSSSQKLPCSFVGAQKQCLFFLLIPFHQEYLSIHLLNWIHVQEKQPYHPPASGTSTPYIPSVRNPDNIFFFHSSAAVWENETPTQNLVEWCFLCSSATDTDCWAAAMYVCQLYGSLSSMSHFQQHFNTIEVHWTPHWLKRKKEIETGMGGEEKQRNTKDANAWWPSNVEALKITRSGWRIFCTLTSSTRSSGRRVINVSFGLTR